MPDGGESRIKYTVPGIADGPWPPDIDKVLNYLKGSEIDVQCFNGVPFVLQGPDSRFEPRLQDQEIGILLQVVEKYGSLTNARIRSVAYDTAPMREVLQKERSGEKMRGKPVFYEHR